MALIRDTISQKDQAKKDKILEIEEQIERIEDDIRRLKIDFDIYFNGGTKKAPLQQRAALESRIKRVNGDRTISYANRYKLNNLISRFTSYRELWRRKLKAKGDEIY
jgi:hypothetical protein